MAQPEDASPAAAGTASGGGNPDEGANPEFVWLHIRVDGQELRPDAASLSKCGGPSGFISAIGDALENQKLFQFATIDGAAVILNGRAVSSVEIWQYSKMEPDTATTIIK